MITQIENWFWLNSNNYNNENFVLYEKNEAITLYQIKNYLG